MDKGLIEIMPIAYIRGLSIDDSIVIIDEAQNINKHTFKTIVTRIGHNSKYIFLGDIEQVDRKKDSESCLETVLDIFKEKDYIGTLEFEDEDCVRNPIIPKILEELRFFSI
jgi:phosphate starvation-inducible PhoH-like protein